MSGKFYVTTPIYYVNAQPHIGHAYSTVVADVLARFHRQLGEEVFFLTGTDEHGQKVAKAAEAREMTPQEHCDDMQEKYIAAWEALGISYDDFIRTTQERHKQAARKIFQILFEKGDIYLGTYKGWYCVHEETFWPENQLVEGNCPECGRPVEMLEEESYYFRTSKYQEPLLSAIESGRFKIHPEVRANEVISFIKEGVEDISISRTALKWGVEVPINPQHVIYVWFEALINYCSGAGYGWDEEKFNRFWPADVHLIGKDILRFHAVIWPSMLLSLGGEELLPGGVLATGFWTLGGQKISKSRGLTIDPIELSKEFSADALRYFLMREIPVGQDGEFHREALVRRINYDLANDLGNLSHRLGPMLEKYCGGVIPEASGVSPINPQYETAIGKIASLTKSYSFNAALGEIWEHFVSPANRYIDQSAPWALFKEDKREELGKVMYNLAESLRVIAILIYPYMPATAGKLWEQIGMKSDLEEQRLPDSLGWGGLPAGNKVKRGEPLFPRILEDEDVD